MTTTTPVAQHTKATFRQDCSVRCEIRATPEQIWSLLTDAPRFPEWNSTVSSLEGTIAAGARLTLKVTLDPKRTFRPTVTKLEPHAEMEWSDGFAPMFKGVRTFTLASKGNGVTEFAMKEVFSGAMLPLVRGSLPDFGPAFEAFARDLKRTAEAGAP
jgi:hypothetical protein